MARRTSGPPRRPRNPVARAVRTPLFRPRVEKDRRRVLPPVSPAELLESELDEELNEKSDESTDDKTADEKAADDRSPDA
jgi:hypothetical protein